MSKILIAYYSRADENYLNGALRYIKKGNTEKVAEHIQRRIGGDLFKIEQIQPYSKDYNSCIAEAQEDLKRNARPQLKAYPDSIDDYTDIYLGYPIYWGHSLWLYGPSWIDSILEVKTSIPSVHMKEVKKGEVF